VCVSRLHARTRTNTHSHAQKCRTHTHNNAHNVHTVYTHTNALTRTYTVSTAASQGEGAGDSGMRSSLQALSVETAPHRQQQPQQPTDEAAVLHISSAAGLLNRCLLMCVLVFMRACMCVFCLCVRACVRVCVCRFMHICVYAL
jgi:hypothetical protein